MDKKRVNGCENSQKKQNTRNKMRFNIVWYMIKFVNLFNQMVVKHSS